MINNTVSDFKKPEPFIDDPIPVNLQEGTAKLLKGSFEAELVAFFYRYITT
jgi:hypothetical protein